MEMVEVYDITHLEEDRSGISTLIFLVIRSHKKSEFLGRVGDNRIRANYYLRRSLQVKG